MIVPQANSFDTLSRLLEAIDGGAGTVADLAQTLGLEPRTVRYYLELAEWLGWFLRSESALTTAGRAFLDGNREAVFREAVLANPLVRDARARVQTRVSLRMACVDAILAASSLAESTAKRRASALASLIQASIPRHVAWLADTGHTLQTADGKPIQIMELRHTDDDAILAAWAKHFRNQYCDDAQIDDLRMGTGLSRSVYLEQIKFPDSTQAPGPSIRSGDFAEVLVADYLEFSLGYWLPRTRYDQKTVRNESTKGSDAIGFKVAALDADDPTDTLAIFETKAQLTGRSSNDRLQTAVNDSAKDEMRKAESLNAIKQRLLSSGAHSKVRTVARFQNREDRPHEEIYGAVALIAEGLRDDSELRAVTTASHPHKDNLTLILIQGNDLMTLVHALYRRAANEA